MRRLIDGVEVEREVVYVGQRGPRLTVFRTCIAGSQLIEDYAGREWQPVVEAS
jgi:hypothetical protein